MPAIVTKESLNILLNRSNDAKKIQIVGRALLALFNRQTEAEQSSDTTQNQNGIGFASCDARGGSLTAKSFLKNRTLAAWQLDRWMALQKDGFPRICRYAKQLNDIAEEKERKERPRLQARLANLRYDYGMAQDSDDPAILDPIKVEIDAIEKRLGGAAAN